MTEPPVAEAPETPARPLGLLDFHLEGRGAPALFVVGWAGTIAGIALASIAILGAPGMLGAVLWFLAFVGLSIGLVLLGGSQSVERKAAGAAYVGPSPMVVLGAVLVVSQVAGYAVGVPLLLVADQVPRPVGDLLVSLLQALVIVGVLRLMVVGTGGLSWREMGLTRGGGTLRALLGGGVFAGPVILVTSVVALAATQLAGAVPPSPLPATGTAAGLALHLAAGAVLAPLGEELLFRGFAQTAWARTAGIGQAIARSAIVFVLAHVLFIGGADFGNALGLAFVAAVARIPVALTLGWLFARTGSLWGPIGLHATYNAILVTIAEVATTA